MNTIGCQVINIATMVGTLNHISFPNTNTSIITSARANVLSSSFEMVGTMNQMIFGHHYLFSALSLVLALAVVFSMFITLVLPLALSVFLALTLVPTLAPKGKNTAAMPNWDFGHSKDNISSISVLK